MKSMVVEGYEAEDINSQVSKVLNDLGNPAPPLRLEQVLDLLSLDRAYYSSNDTGLLGKYVHRIRVAGKQILRRPTLLLDAIRKADLNALYLPDDKRILIDASKPQLKHRWFEAHEIGHSLIPWHEPTNYGDIRSTLRHECRVIVEAEANYAAGQLLFLGPRFVLEAQDLRPSIESVRQLAKRYGNTITSTLWRYVEDVHPDVPVVAAISDHPWCVNRESDLAGPCRHYVRSPAYRRMFSRITESQLFTKIRSYCRPRRCGMIGEADVVPQDDRGGSHILHFQSFSNTYDALTLGVWMRGRPVAVSV